MPAQIITKISPQKNTERLNIYLNDEFAFGIAGDLLDTYSLTVGAELTAGMIETIKAEDTVKKCLNKAYRYLSYRPRSEKEVQDKLLEKYDPDTVEQAIDKLKGYGYVDDNAFVRFWIEARGNTRGPRLLRSELYKKGVPKEIIAEHLLSSNETQIEYALSLIQSKRKYQGLTKDEAYKRVAPFLARRGYGYDVIKEVIKAIEPN